MNGCRFFLSESANTYVRTKTRLDIAGKSSWEFSYVIYSDSLVLIKHTDGGGILSDRTKESVE